MIAAAGIALSVILVILTGGKISRLGELRLPHEGLLLALFVCQGLARGRFSSPAEAMEIAVTVWGFTCVALVALLWTIRRRPGVPVVISGLVANMLVVLANDGMPYRIDGVPAPESDGAFYHAVGASTRVWVLGDVLPFPGGFLFSVGDLLLLVGLVVFVVSHASPLRPMERPSSERLLNARA